MTWKTTLAATKTIVGIVERAIETIETLVDAWNGAPEEAAEQQREALACIGRLQSSLQGVLDRADIRELEKPLDD